MYFFEQIVLQFWILHSAVWKFDVCEAFDAVRGTVLENTFARTYIYSRAMKTQHPNVNQYLNDLLNMLLQGISGDFMNTKDIHHIDLISFNVKCPTVYAHAHIQTVV